MCALSAEDWAWFLFVTLALLGSVAGAVVYLLVRIARFIGERKRRRAACQARFN